MRFGISKYILPLIKLLVFVVAISQVSRIAWQSRFDSHPDEFVHIDGFHYFENHWWPPDYGDDSVIYSCYGWSRVYTGEIVYLIYGKLSAIVNLVMPETKPCYLRYRFFNVGLLYLTLLVLFTAPGWFRPAIIGATMLSIPQVLYLYSYTNSDAWGISISLFLFVVVMNVTSKPLKDSFTWGRVVLTGLLTGMLLTSKTPFILALILPSILMGIRIRSDFIDGYFEKSSWVWKRLIVVVFLILIIVAPLKIVYPAMQSHAGNTIEAMRELKATDAYRPSNITYPLYRMAANGKTYKEMLCTYKWGKFTAQSFYGRFGYMNIVSPLWCYVTAAIGASVLLLLNIYMWFKRRRDISSGQKWCLIISPIILLLNIYASIFHSFHNDFQPQGRYLFTSLIPISFMLAGVNAKSKKGALYFRVIVYTLLFVMSMYVLAFVVVPAEYFRPQ